jgi:predicted dehydrogenase
VNLKLRIGKISYWHVHAWDYTKQAQEHPDTEIVAVWDEDAERGKAAAEKLGVPFYESIENMLKQDNIDAVIVDAPTRMHHELIIAACRAGKHIFTEKVLAPTVQEANEILSEVRKSGVKLTVSLPRLDEGVTLAIQDILSRKLLGDVTKVRVRLAHDGAIKGWLPDHFYSLEDCLGGALIDLGCHPMYLVRLFLNQEIVDVSARYTYLTGKSVEDNAVSVLTTKSGAIGIAEAAFVNMFSPYVIEINGTEGTLMYGTPENKLLLRASRPDLAGRWHEQELPAHRESSFEQWVKHIQSNTNAEENIKIAAELTKLVEASNISVRENRIVSLQSHE